jgi:hypothetical protein
MKTKLFISGIAFLAITTLGSAQNNEKLPIQQDNSGRGSTYVDADKNGICDNYENKTPNFSGGKGNGNWKDCNDVSRLEQQRHQGDQGQCRKNNFVDENKNGICDFSETPFKK